ncbi:MAG: alpha-amylase family glycosyl hydrolase [Spirochaetales bacterium]
MKTSRDFHVRRQVREKYEFDRRVFSLRGNVLFPDLQSCRMLSARMNAERQIETHPDRAVHTSDIYAMGLIEEIMHYVIGLYREQVDSKVGTRLYAHLRESVPEAQLEALLARFVEEFPPLRVHSGELSPEEFLDTDVEGVPGREVALEEMLLLHLQNGNPAYAPFIDLFDDTALAESSVYSKVVDEIRSFFENEPEFGPENAGLIDTLEAPAKHVPDSLEGQLQYIRERWGSVIGRFLYRLLRGIDFLREEKTMRGGPGGAPETYVYTYDEREAESAERFSPDRYWMPNVVLLAKTALVWLDQLTRAWGYSITRLDEVPDGELDTIAARGFTGLWLIGLWERSPASKRIKNLCGNPEAEASAYSLYDYTIAESLGGWDALADLRQRCEARGVRLASDMVPNHTGIDSKWVHEHPDWFLQLDHCPYPSYRFNGENLSSHPGIQIYLEDHYYERSDAAVVFKRVDEQSERYIYHGNDGTSMPWNDTAQLDYLKPDVREAVIQTILHVARNFSIIRFDAAMTLAKKHVQRLWYPQPGSGGAIPSRSEHGLTQEEFDRQIPQEFWREVVDRVAEEVPDTLLLAEAFWMMESYFVRSLGMHRVYNSAFMNMLKNEDNAKYRETIKNTLEFDPQILKRFVNFMNNPDEETAVAQFGKGDKYFGVATLMLTMPGLPMFGHGQVEGFAEKYGMEYSRAYWEETPDTELIRRHNRELSPLARRRSLFAEADEFELFDLHVHHGGVGEDVFAYSNRAGEARTLVLYNNSYDSVSGWIHRSTPRKRQGSHELAGRSIGEALALRYDQSCFMIAREHVTGLWFIRNSAELHERGLGVMLEGYRTQVFLDIYEVADSHDGHYRRLAEELGGAGTPNIDKALEELFLRPLHQRFDELVQSDAFARVFALFDDRRALSPQDRAALYRGYYDFAEVFSRFSGLPGDPQAAADRFVSLIGALEGLLSLENSHAPYSQISVDAAQSVLFAPLSAKRGTFEKLVGMLTLEPLSEFSDRVEADHKSALRYDAASIAKDFMLGERWAKHFGTDGGDVVRAVNAGLMLSDWRSFDGSISELMQQLFQDYTIGDYVGVNIWESVTWFDRAAMEELVWWLLVTGLLPVLVDQVDPAVARGESRLGFPALRPSGRGGVSASEGGTTARGGDLSGQDERVSPAEPDMPRDARSASSPSASVGPETLQNALSELARLYEQLVEPIHSAESAADYKVYVFLEKLAASARSSSRSRPSARRREERG